MDAWVWVVLMVAVPQIVKGLEGIPIKKLAVHSGGRHTLALSINGEVYSWGEGEDGKLGHGNMRYFPAANDTLF